jgi:anti-sigma B factor antagonist
VNVQFRADTEPLDGGHAVNVSGELDQATVPQLKRVLGEALGSQNGGAIFVDLSDCEFIDSTGLSLLVQAQRRLTEEQRGFAICCPKAEVKRLLELTGIDEAVGMFDTRDEAVAALQQRAAAS